MAPQNLKFKIHSIMGVLITISIATAYLVIFKKSTDIDKGFKK